MGPAAGNARTHPMNHRGNRKAPAPQSANPRARTPTMTEWRVPGKVVTTVRGLLLLAPWGHAGPEECCAAGIWGDQGTCHTGPRSPRLPLQMSPGRSLCRRNRQPRHPFTPFPLAPPPPQKLEAPVRKIILQMHTLSAGVSKPSMDSECASGCTWSTARETARLRDSRPWSSQTGQDIQGLR